MPVVSNNLPPFDPPLTPGPGPCAVGIQDSDPTAELFRTHPRPWRLGESKTSTTDIVDANGHRIASVQSGGILLGHKATPQFIVDLVNAL